MKTTVPGGRSKLPNAEALEVVLENKGTALHSSHLMDSPMRSTNINTATSPPSDRFNRTTLNTTLDQERLFNSSTQE